MNEYRFCPRCATLLTERADPEHEGGRVRQSCPDAACGYVHWNNSLPVVAAIVEYEGKILLARNAAWPEGMFPLITGFLENGETPEQLEYQLVEPAKLRPWRAGTGPALGEWMRRRGLPFEYVERPGQ
ncbi:MAG: Nudix hydrolase family protein [uncultured Paraburkholderia sp.]|nr:MAG: Nudix hydrolase family protein [uncultured Paraburkholderia sp.]CAH2925386.1 MAG: Nudix hydrolase family protein [uncultured Paraburkholderia sp.]